MLQRRIDAGMLKTRDNYISKLQSLGIYTIRDLLTYFPRTYRDEQEFSSINMMRTDEVNVIQVKLKSIHNMRTRTGKSMTRAVVSDSTGELPVMWFNQPHLKKMFFKGSQIILTGKLKYDRGKMMMLSPKYEKPKSTLLHTGRIVPVYSETEGVSSKWLREKIHMMLPYVDYFQDDLPVWIREKEALMSFSQAIYHVHFAQDEEHLIKARERLAFEELFMLQLMALRRKKIWQMSFLDFKSESSFDVSPFVGSLPFQLTGAQNRVIDEILSDFIKEHPMLRLVQGDVGAGKTVVAAAAIFAIHSIGKQSALMAPTEILAKQHFKNLVKSLTPFGFNIQLLTGSNTQKEKENVLIQLATGTCDLVIGTHSIIQEGVEFKDLGLAIVDEQHRFGVKQRSVFRNHGSPHILSLSATPIPRTLALTLYGDQDLSILDEMPPGRQEIVTRIVPEKKREDAYFWINDQVEKGRQVFIICPLVEESETLELKAATEEYARLKDTVFTEHSLALLHGKMKGKDKEEVMKKFASGETQILVSTSVVEVGIDVPNASIILIEGSERFGLAQLHQFRGRVGRGEHQSYCFLFTDSSSGDSLRRLKSMVEYSSGFDLAEMDLSLRGPGEVFGVKQSGLPDLKMANLTDAKMLDRARSCAMNIIEEDPCLEKHLILGDKIKKLEEYMELRQK